MFKDVIRLQGNHPAKGIKTIWSTIRTVQQTLPKMEAVNATTTDTATNPNKAVNSVVIVDRSSQLSRPNDVTKRGNNQQYFIVHQY